MKTKFDFKLAYIQEFRTLQDELIADFTKKHNESQEQVIKIILFSYLNYFPTQEECEESMNFTVFENEPPGALHINWKGVDIGMFFTEWTIDHGEYITQNIHRMKFDIKYTQWKQKI